MKEIAKLVLMIGVLGMLWEGVFGAIYGTKRFAVETYNKYLIEETYVFEEDYVEEAPVIYEFNPNAPLGV